MLVFAAAAVLAGGCWYARAWACTGNPVYPFFRHTFGGRGIDEVLDPIKRPMAVDAWNLLTALGPMTLRPDRFDSFSHQFGPAFLLFLPALLLERPPRRVLAIAAIGYAFLTLCLSQRQSMRFVLIAVGPMSVAVAWLMSTWCDRRSVPGRLLVGACLLVLAFEAGLAAARRGRAWASSSGARPPSSSCRVASQPSAWGDGSTRTCPETPIWWARIIAASTSPAPTRWSWRTGGGPASAAAARRPRRSSRDSARPGSPTCCSAPRCPRRPSSSTRPSSRLLAPWLDGRPPMYREDLADADGVVRRYAIYRLERLPLGSRTPLQRDAEGRGWGGPARIRSAAIRVPPRPIPLGSSHAKTALADELARHDDGRARR